jgi:hypothetical protein
MDFRKLYIFQYSDIKFLFQGCIFLCNCITEHQPFEPPHRSGEEDVAKRTGYAYLPGIYHLFYLQSNDGGILLVWGQ